MRIRRGQLRRDDARLALPALPALPVAEPDQGPQSLPLCAEEYEAISGRRQGYLALLYSLRQLREPSRDEIAEMDVYEAGLRERARMVAG